MVVSPFFWLHCCRNKEPLIFDTEEQARKEMDEIKFEEWKKEVSAIMVKDGWEETTVANMDWEAWHNFYFLEGMKPEDAIREDLANAL